MNRPRQVNPRWKKVTHTKWRMGCYTVQRCASGIYTPGLGFIYLMRKNGVEFDRKTVFRTAQQICEQLQDAEIAAANGDAA